MKKTYYTNAPEPKDQDWLLPYFLKDEEKYVELMAAVANLLDDYPYVEHEDFARLAEAYSQVIRGPHVYMGISAINFNYEPKKLYLVPGTCIWCGKDSFNHS